SRLHRAGIFNIGTYEEAQDEIAKIRRLDLTLDEEKIITQLAKEGALDEHQKLLARIDKRRSAIEEPAIGDLSRFAELMETIRRSLGLDWQKKVEAYRKINLIASCSPKVLDVKLQTFLDRNNLGIDASAIDISKKGTELSQMLSKLMGSTNFADICRDIGVTDTSSLKELYAALDHLKNTVNMIKLTTLSPEAIAFDRLTVVGGNPDATPSLAATLESCRKYFEGTIIEAEIDGVKDLIGGTSEVARERNLLFIFTDNPLVGLTIGRYPIGAQSCQKYWNGSDTLAAYPADAMTKICILVDKSKLPDEILSEFDSAGSEDERLRIFNRSTDRFLEAIVARRVTKVVRKILPKREPALFLEPIYTPYDRRQMTKYMNMGAVSGLLKELGLPLVCGGSSFKVKVAGSRNTEQYEDGEFGGPDNGGMGTKTGEYTMAARDLREDDYK
ncbi:MAG: hypothetical protein Q7S31_01275, partial [bacterium]|nr:hypothetical protein [bacterium]